MPEKRSRGGKSVPAGGPAPAEAGAGGRERADLALVARGLAPSRARAQDLIRRGLVSLNGQAISRPNTPVAPDAMLTLADEAPDWVSRGAEKLVAALDAFGFDPAGLCVADLGASTGGFTEVLLRRGARQVVALDVGHDQLHPRLRAEPRVICREGVNVRHLTADDFTDPPQGLVADLSFISLKTALPAALGLAAPRAFGAFLVKPQFEVGREGLSRGGLVRDGALAQAALEDVAGWLDRQPGWRVTGHVDSPILGGDGNREFLLGAVKDRPA